MTNARSDFKPVQQHRQQFPALANKRYFNYGGQGPMPEGAIAALYDAHARIQHEGPFSRAVNAMIEQEMHSLRGAIAAELGTTANAIALTENVSAGCNIVLWGLNWREGDHILLTDCEHPSVIASVEELRRRFGVKVTTCPIQGTLNGGDPVLTIEQYLLPTTRLVVVSHILWNTGQVLPLAKIVQMCHAHPTQAEPIQVLVDAAQSVGVLPLELDALRADFYAFTGHKWWCGAAGGGGLYVHPTALQRLSPTFIGWRGITKAVVGEPPLWKPDSRRYEVATSDYPVYGALKAAIATHHYWGTAAERYQRICQLSAYLWERLQALSQVECLRTAPPESGLVSFRLHHPQKSHADWVADLERQEILVRKIEDPDCVRACVHYLTLEEECDRLVEAIAQGMKA
jgi:L-cysteine/cystine lyase